MAERTTGTGIPVAVGIGMAMATMAVVGAIAILANPMCGPIFSVLFIVPIILSFVTFLLPSMDDPSCNGPQKS